MCLHALRHLRRYRDYLYVPEHIPRLQATLEYPKGIGFYKGTMMI